MDKIMSKDSNDSWNILICISIQLGLHTARYLDREEVSNGISISDSYPNFYISRTIGIGHSYLRFQFQREIYYNGYESSTSS